MKNPNGYGTIIKLSGNRRRPYACRKTVGFNDNGYPIYKYISYHKTKREAMQALAEYNKNPYSLSKITFKDAFERFIEQKKGTVKRLTDMKSLHNNYMTPLDNMHMSDITLGSIQAYFDKLETTQSTLVRIKSVLGQVIDYCVKRELMPLSAKEITTMIDMTPKKETRTVNREVFARSEIEWLWDHKDGDTPHILLFYIYTGLRYDEIHHAEWHNDFIRVTEAKTSAGVRDVPLSDKAKSLLPLPSVPEYKTLWKRMKRISLDIGTKHNVHDCRHTFISLLTEAGVDARIIKKIVGHTTDDITEDVYTHISLKTILEAVNKI